jgi:hypothetical protein
MPEHFHLADLNGNLILMRDGKPFTYTTRELARAGQFHLSKHLGITLAIV